MTNTITNRLRQLGIVPVVALEDAGQAISLADALADGQLPIVELTFRTDAAADAIARIRKERPDLLVGAGTVRTVEQLRQARDAGAEFIVAPGFNPDIASACAGMGLPFIPGVMTPSEIDRALLAGLSVLKFFPAETAGGLEGLKAMAAPFRQTGVQFMPTGGVNAKNFEGYLASDLVIAVGGTWIAPSAAIAGGDWTAITQRCREARAAVDALRAGKGR